MTKFIIGIVVIAAIFLGYQFFIKGSAEPTAGLVGLAPAGAGVRAAPADEFLKLLLSLRAIDLSAMPKVITTLNVLEDFSTELESQIPGRENPFAPIGVGRAPAPITASTTATSSPQ